MTDPDAAQLAREWLERQLVDLGQLRNASRRDQTFKTWRQQTLTVIQRIWPGDTRRVDCFRRIPFSPPTTQATARQARECYERGWGEAGVLLRGFLAEIKLRGLPQVRPAGTYAGAETEAAMGPMPALGVPDVPEREAVPAEAGTLPDPQVPESADEDELGRAMERLMSHSPVFRDRTRMSPPALSAMTPEPGSAGAELMRLAGELETLGLAPARATAAREALLALAWAAQSGVPAWNLVSDALGHAGATPALARRALPLLLGFVERAA